MYVCIHVCVYASMHVCMYVRTSTHIYEHAYACMYILVCVCVCIYIYIYNTQVAYGLSKMGVNVYTQVLAREQPGLRVNACSPGFTNTGCLCVIQI